MREPQPHRVGADGPLAAGRSKLDLGSGDVVAPRSRGGIPPALAAAGDATFTTQVPRRRRAYLGLRAGRAASV